MVVSVIIDDRYIWEIDLRIRAEFWERAANLWRKTHERWERIEWKGTCKMLIKHRFSERTRKRSSRVDLIVVGKSKYGYENPSGLG
jgi:hypothetical protein